MRGRHHFFCKRVSKMAKKRGHALHVEDISGNRGNTTTGEKPQANKAVRTQGSTSPLLAITGLL